MVKHGVHPSLIYLISKKHKEQLINENGKLRICSAKNKFGFETYLDIVNEPNHRRYITKF